MADFHQRAASSWRLLRHTSEATTSGWQRTRSRGLKGAGRADRITDKQLYHWYATYASETRWGWWRDTCCCVCEAAWPGCGRLLLPGLLHLLRAARPPCAPSVRPARPAPHSRILRQPRPASAHQYHGSFTWQHPSYSPSYMRTSSLKLDEYLPPYSGVVRCSRRDLCETVLFSRSVF